MYKPISDIISSRFIFSPLNIFFKPKYLFIFSHMRSRSSVLSHILGSNSQICGYSELQIPYIDKASIEKMRSLLSAEQKCTHSTTNIYSIKSCMSLSSQIMYLKLLNLKLFFCSENLRVPLKAL